MRTLGGCRSCIREGRDTAQRPAAARLSGGDITAALRGILRVRAARQATRTEHCCALLRTLIVSTATRAARRAARGSSGATGISSSADIASCTPSAGSAGIAPARQSSGLTGATLQFNAFVAALVGVDVAFLVTKVAATITETGVGVRVSGKDGRLSVLGVCSDTGYDTRFDKCLPHERIFWPVGSSRMFCIGLVATRIATAPDHAFARAAGATVIWHTRPIAIFHHTDRQFAFSIFFTTAYFGTQTCTCRRFPLAPLRVARFLIGNIKRRRPA